MLEEVRQKAESEVRAAAIADIAEGIISAELCQERRLKGLLEQQVATVSVSNHSFSDKQGSSLIHFHDLP